MLDFLKPFISLDCPITDWIMAIATVVLVVIAGMANGTWKREIRERKEAELSKKLYDILLRMPQDFEIWNYDGEAKYKQISEIFQTYKESLKYILFEYSLLKGNKIICSDIEYLIEFFEYYFRGGKNPKTGRLAFHRFFEFFDDFQPRQIGDVENDTFDLIYTGKAKEVFEKIEKLKCRCKEALKDFYQP